MAQFGGKTALVTGAGSGIGRTVALRFAAAGAGVAVTDVNPDTARAVAAEIEAAGGRAMPLAMDVASEAAVEDGVARTLDYFGRIDILVSNAGIQIVSPVHELAYADWQKVLTIHLDGAFLATRACLKSMYASGGGSIVYMGSVHSKEASKFKAPYVAAKHALIGLCKVVAKEGAEFNVRANVVCPGYVRTPLVDKQIPEQAARLGISEAAVVRDVMLRDTVDGVFTTTDDVAEAVLFFAGYPNNALTGQSMILSHGWCME